MFSIAKTRMFKLALLLALVVLVAGRIPNKKARSELTRQLGKNAIQINTTPEVAIELTQHWVDQAFSALVSTVAQEKIHDVSRWEAREHEKCVKETDDIVEHAKCVSELLNVHRVVKKRRQGLERSIERARKNKDDQKWVGAFYVRQKREIINRNNYQLKSTSDVSPFALIARGITKTVRALKNKNETRSWQQIMVSIKEQGTEMEKRKSVREMLTRSLNARSRIPTKGKVLINDKKIADSAYRKRDQVYDRRPLANSLDDYDDQSTSSEIEAPAEKLVSPSEMIKEFQEHPEKLLSSNALDKMNITAEQKETVMRVKMIRQGVRLVMELAGQNTTDFDTKNLRFASPRFFSVVPEPKKTENDTINVLSPSLFSLHEEGSHDERKLSLHTAFGALPHGGEQNAWMDMLTEVTGVADAVDDAAKKVKTHTEGVVMGSSGEEVPMTKANITKLYGEDNYRKMKTLEQLHGMYTPEQLETFNKTGYAIMTEAQRQVMYGKGAPFEDEKAIVAGRNLTMDTARQALHSTIREVGKGTMKLNKYDKRQKDLVLSPLLFASFIAMPAAVSQALILSPVLFTPLILSPAVFGSVILSPWVFVPVILAPRVLSPVVLSPALFSPIILSPLVLDPIILTPGVGNPLVLSPYVLCPFILSPQVMTPLILSPFALSPAILNPNLMGPLVLSPFVLSPIIYSPSTLTAIVLSPYALSPSIESPPNLIAVVASPSILS